MTANPLLDDLLPEVDTVWATPFDDPELGPRWYLKFVHAGRRSAAIVDDADLPGVELNVRRVIRQRPAIVEHPELRA